MTQPPQRITSRGGPLVEVVRHLAAYLVLPNLPFWILGLFAFLTRPVINVDYLAFGALAPLLPHWLAIAGFCLLLLNDTLSTLAPVFHFGIDAAAASLQFAWELGPGFWVFATGLLASVLAVATITHHISNKRTSLAVATGLACTMGAIIAFDVLTGASRFSHADRVRVPLNLATSAAYATTSELLKQGLTPRRDADETQVTRVASVTGPLAAVLGGSDAARSAPNVLLVMVESLGSLRDSTRNAVLLAPLLDSAVRSRYRLRSGTIHSRGATTSGELRELCGVYADYRSVPAAPLVTCLPREARQHGYATIAIHGYTGRLFRRNQWYPSVGFERSWFAEQLTSRSDVHVCGTMLRGAKDTDVTVVVRDELRREPDGQPRFVYWLTLNAHLPLDRSCLDGLPIDCPALGLPRYPEEVCRLVQLHRAVARSVAEIATDSTLPPMHIVIVGDHPPPFLSRVSRAAFAENRVPFVELTPHPDAADGATTRGRLATPAGRNPSHEGTVNTEQEPHQRE